jgi:hypothetical protein
VPIKGKAKADNQVMLDFSAEELNTSNLYTDMAPEAPYFLFSTDFSSLPPTPKDSTIETDQTTETKDSAAEEETSEQDNMQNPKQDLVNSEVETIEETEAEKEAISSEDSKTSEGVVENSEATVEKKKVTQRKSTKKSQISNQDIKSVVQQSIDILKRLENNAWYSEYFTPLTKDLLKGKVSIQQYIDLENSLNSLKETSSDLYDPEKKMAFIINALNTALTLLKNSGRSDYEERANIIER